MDKRKFQSQKKIMYTKELNASDEEESDNPRDVLFLALTQDENA